MTTGCANGAGKPENEIISCRHLAGLVSPAYAGLRKRDSIGNAGSEPASQHESACDAVSFQKALGNLMNTFSRFPNPRLWIAVDISGVSGGEKTLSLRLSQPRGAVTTTWSKQSSNPSAAFTRTSSPGLFSIRTTSQLSRRST